MTPKTPNYYTPLARAPRWNKKSPAVSLVGANAPPLQGESSALLLMALERGTNGAGKSADLFGANNIKPVPFPTSNNSGTMDLDVLKDDWGTPLQFYRWSTTNADLDAAIPATQG